MHEAHCFAHAGGSSPNLCTVQGNIWSSGCVIGRDKRYKDTKANSEGALWLQRSGGTSIVSTTMCYLRSNYYVEYSRANTRIILHYL